GQMQKPLVRMVQSSSRRSLRQQMRRSMQRTHVSEIKEKIGGMVRICGFAEVIRDQKRMQFIIMNDHTGRVQLVHERAADDPIAKTIEELTVGSAIEVTGRVAAAPNVRLNGVEVVLDEIKI